jgi:methylmalonyl-CoA/ethylmalonyl-CoA epimerase
MITNINHIAIVVSDMENGKQFWHDVLGLPLGGEHRETQEGVDVAFLPIGESNIELLQPFEQNSISAFLEKRGPGIHHICLEVDDIETALLQLKAAEIRLIHDTPRRNAHGNQFAFLHPKSTGGVLVELYELAHDA